MVVLAGRVEDGPPDERAVGEFHDGLGLTVQVLVTPVKVGETAPAPPDLGGLFAQIAADDSLQFAPNCRQTPTMRTA